MLKKFFPFFLFLFAGGLWLLFFFSPFYVLEKYQPGFTYHGFPINLNGDYYHYTYFLKSGLEGRLNFENVYTDAPQPLQFLEPHYNLVGILFRPFNVNAFELFTLLRILAPLSMLAAVVYLVVNVINSKIVQLTSVLVVIFSTNFWWFGQPSPEVYSPMFSVSQKILMLPPHYFVSTAITILILIISAKIKNNWKVTGLLLFLFLNLTVMHPYIGVMTYGFLIVDLIIEMLREKRLKKSLILKLFVIGSGVAPIILYYQYMLSYVWGSVSLANVRAADLPITAYLLSLGPLLIISLPALFFRESWRNPLLVKIIIWAYLPIGYFLSNIIGIPLSIYRVYQTYQQIPLGLLSIVSIYKLNELIPFKLKKTSFLISIGLIILYGVIPFLLDFDSITQHALPYHRWKFEIEVSNGLVNYINNNIPKNTVVLAPNTISALLPSFTGVKVIIGIEGCNPNYYKNLALADKFYLGEMNQMELLEFIKKYKIEYIVFGISSLKYNQLPYYQASYFRTVYEDDQVSVVKPVL